MLKIFFADAGLPSLLYKVINVPDAAAIMCPGTNTLDTSVLFSEIPVN